MPTTKSLPFNKSSQPSNNTADCTYMFAVDGSNSMLLQAAPFGQWLRAEAAVQLISRQIFNLCKTEGKRRNHFIIIGYNAENALVIPYTSKQILWFFMDSEALSNHLLAELKKLGGAQSTNRGLNKVKKIYDEWLKERKLPKRKESADFSDMAEICNSESKRPIKVLLFTDAEDAVDHDLTNPFKELKPDPLIGIFIGSNKLHPGWIAFRHILSQCSSHGKKQLFALDGFSSFSKLESPSFLSFSKNLSGMSCPSCLKPRKEKTVSGNEGLDLVVSEPTKLSQQKRSDKKCINRISAEIFVTAGPRKDDDVALGEDAGGVVVEQDLAYFWVADGTSESPVVLDYSSRALAVELGAHLCDELGMIPAWQLINCINYSSELISDLLQKAFNSLLKSWTSTLDDILESDSRQKIIDRAFELDSVTSEATSRTHKEFIDFSTTFLCGVVTKDGNGLAACIGDCTLCVGSDEGFQVCNLSNNRIFVRLRKNGVHYRFDRNRILKDITFQRFSNASLIMAGSDGIGQLPEFLSTQMKSFRWPDIRKRIHRFIPKSHDDKTFCIIRVG